MTVKKLNEKLLIAVLLLVIQGLYAQDTAYICLGYTTEVQNNFGKKYNWVNLLSVSGEIPSEKISRQWKNGSLGVEFISIFKIFEKRIAKDLMTFSNIEEDNLPISPFLLGYMHQWKNISLFGGIRNINHDYFTMPYTSLFTNSSAGIFPTLSLNFELANYPLSAMCLHFEYTPTNKWLFKASLYNGIAHAPNKNIFHTFTVNPREDGIFSISELSYTQNKFGNGTYSLGMAFRAFGKKFEATYSIWGALEQSVFDNEKQEIGLVCQGGFAPPDKNECGYYCAAGVYFAGLVTKQKHDKLGIYLNATEVAGIKENTMEITWQFQIIDLIAVQPTFHCIRTGNRTTSIGLFRFKFLL